MKHEVSLENLSTKNSITQIHYDKSISFYKSFLDKKYMKYTSGLYITGEESLDEAISKMLDLHISLLRKYESPKILEIGPGWGSLLSRIVDVKFRCNYTAVNPSSAQNKYILKSINPNATIIESSFEKADIKGSFDCIVLIGSFCHFNNKPQQLKKLRNLLSPNGIIVFEDTFFISEELFKDHAFREETKFVQKKVFGFAEILSFPSFLNLAANCGLNISYSLEHSESYKKTIEAWIGKLNTTSKSNKIETDMYCKYMEIAQRGWNHTIANYLITLKKSKY